MSPERSRRLLDDLRLLDARTPDRGEEPRTPLQVHAASQAAELINELIYAAMMHGDSVRVRGTRYRFSVADDDIKTVSERGAAAALLADSESVFRGSEVGDGVSASDLVCRKFLADYPDIVEGFAAMALSRTHRELLPASDRSTLLRVTVRCARVVAEIVRVRLPRLYRVAAPCVVQVDRMLKKHIVVQGVAENIGWGLAAGALAGAPVLFGTASGVPLVVLIAIGVAAATTLSNQRVVDYGGLVAKQRQYDRLLADLGPERRLKAAIALGDHAARLRSTVGSDRDLAA